MQRPDSSLREFSALQILLIRIDHLGAGVVGQADDLALLVAHEAFEIIALIGNSDHGRRQLFP
jgi:hypothetical protein